MEGYTAGRNRRVLREMTEIVPTHAIRVEDGREELIPVEMLRIGDEILVPAGERIPMDGNVITGQSAVNQAPITGESLPVERVPGDEVFAGTINGQGVLTIRLTRLAEDTTIQRIIHLIEQAQQVRAPTQRFIDRFARVYTPVVVLIAVLIATIPPIFFNQPFLSSSQETGWLYRGLTLLVIACPCALVISAPVTILSSITAAARKGVLIKGGSHLEALSSIRLFAFDKTGTLTQGSPAVTAFRSVDCANGQQCSDCDDVLALASALERRSAHPLARSVVVAAQERGLEGFYPAAENVIAMPGSGIQGRLNGRLATIGSHTLFEEHHPHERVLCDWVEEAEQRGETTMLLSDGDRVRGFIALADQPRSEGHAAISELHALGKQTAILTGDNATVAQAVAAQVGIDYIRAGLLPEDKLSAIQNLQNQWGRVAMIGDGINDTPALAAATLGVAVGGASSAQALETADIGLMGADLRLLPFAVRLSNFTRRLIHQNVVFSLATKLVFVTLALGGLTSLWLAVLADVGVSLLVTANGLRANKFEGNRSLLF